jgi:hypothetical protein
MSDETQMLRTIDWRSVFPFTHLFRAFRVAIHPAKLILALIAILLVYGAGRTLDGIWMDRHLAVPNEVELYESPRTTDFDSAVAARRAEAQARRDSVVREVLIDTKKPEEAVPEAKSVSNGDAKRLIAQRRETALSEARAARDIEEKAATTPEAQRAVRERYHAAVAAAFRQAGEDLAAVRDANGVGLCLTFINYQAIQIDAVAGAILSWDWTGSRGVLASLNRFIVTGPAWAIGHHPYFFTLFLAIALLVWSVIGGAIARIAAVHVSQDEKISVRQALRFSLNKLMSFFAAPVMPLLLVGIITLLLALIGWVSEIQYLGGAVTIIVGALFIVLILVGVLVACALIAWVCGFGLMYPTIAVEGSDAFDAVSRSFSYVFARPWKMFFYAIIGLIYGAITYVFLRYVIYLTLSFLHSSLNLWTSQTAPTGYTSIANAWTGPDGPFDLSGTQHSNFSLTLAESIGGGLLTFWTYLFIALLGAYLLSFFVSVNTIMYYLLRYEVDATEIDDVYLEPNDDEFEDSGMDTPAPSPVSAPETAAQAVGSPAAGTSSTSPSAPSSEPAPKAPAAPASTEGVLPPPTPPPAGS